MGMRGVGGGLEGNIYSGGCNGILVYEVLIYIVLYNPNHSRDFLRLFLKPTNKTLELDHLKPQSHP